MNFTTPSLATKYAELVLLRQLKAIKTSDFKERVKVLADKQKQNDVRNQKAREKREALREAERQKEIARQTAIAEAKEKATRERAKAKRKEAQAEANRIKQEALRKKNELKLIRQYPNLRDVEQTDVDTLQYGRVADWVKDIPVKYFTLRLQFRNGTLIKEAHKRDDDNNADWWRTDFWSFMDNSDQTRMQQVYKAIKREQELVVLPVSDIDPSKEIQMMRDGTKHCIFGMLETFYTEKMEETKSPKLLQVFRRYIKLCKDLSVKYDGGISVDDIEKETDCMNITIYIYGIDDELRRVLNPKKKYSYKFKNSRWNHCDEYFPDNKGIELNENEMKIKFSELIQSNTNFRYEANNSGVNKIYTNEKFVLKTEYDELFREFNKSINKDWYGVDYIKEKGLFEYIQSAYAHNAHMKFQELVDDLKETDCKAGYTQFKKAPVYRGFMGTVWDGASKLELSDVYENIGIYTFEILQVNSSHLRKAGFEVGKCYTMTSPMIEFLTMNKGRVLPRLIVKVLNGVYGSKFDMEFPETFMQKYQDGKIGDKGVPLYSIWSGMNASASNHKVIRSHIEYKMAQQLRAEGIDIQWVYDESCYINTQEKFIVDGKRDIRWVKYLKEGVLEMENPPGYAIQLEKKERSFNTPQIYAFITDYMRMNMLFEMEKININDLYAWKVDSIVYKGDYKFRDIFREKPVKTMGKDGREFFMSSYIFKPVEPMDTTDCPIIKTNTLFAGGGGSGKSHFASSFRRMLYVAPMWAMCVDFFKKYGIQTTSVHGALGLEGCRPYCEESHFTPANVFCDEATMWNPEWKDMMIKAFPHSRIIFAGDFDDKGRPFQTVSMNKCMNITGLNRMEFNNDYRATGELVDIKKQIREFMYSNYGNTTALKVFIRDLLPSRFVNEIDYKNEDWILCGTNANVDEWTDKFKDIGSKFLCNDHKRSDIYKAFNGEDIALNGQIINEDNGRCVSRRAFTIHSAQGKTIKDRIFIDMRKMSFDYSLLYTAISRATCVEQLYFVF